MSRRCLFKIIKFKATKNIQRRKSIRKDRIVHKESKRELLRISSKCTVTDNYDRTIIIETH
jgi:hypothetical protein